MWAHRMQNSAGQLRSVLLAVGYVYLMQTAIEDDLGHFQSVLRIPAEMGNSDVKRHGHISRQVLWS